MILHIIRTLGVNGGTGYAYEYGGRDHRRADDGRAHDRLQHVHRGRRARRLRESGRDDLRLSRRAARTLPQGAAWDDARSRTGSRSRPIADARYDDVVNIDAADIAPTVTWGINPGQAISVNENVPAPEDASDDAEPRVDRGGARVHEARGRQAHQGDAQSTSPSSGAAPTAGSPIFARWRSSSRASKVAARREGARRARLAGRRARRRGRGARPTSSRDAGFEWREPGCSMCLAMNPDKLIGDELCASSSNRNFKGRQGSPTGRTILMSPVMVAAAAVRGAVADAREVFGI